ncbi:MAG: hypothetical protein CMJ38_07545 [Phycisphaerae bacterium]|nr:hypothetical protein [Phycisphaerae bacterium]
MMNESNANQTLFKTACILAVLLAVSMMWKSESNMAVAGGAVTGEGFSMLSVPNGSGTEFLYVIDDKTAMLMVYSIPDAQNRKFIKPEASWLLPALFNTVRN